MVQLYVNIQFKVKTLRKYMYKFKLNQNQNYLNWPKVCTKFKSLAQVLADKCKCQISRQTIKYMYVQ